MTKVVALHGFLGTPEDLTCFFKEQEVLGVDLLKEKYPEESMEAFAKRFCKNVQEESILCGYSLGGRVALHLLFEQPTLWKAAIFISTHPGIEPDFAQERWQADCLWAERFKRDDWKDVMADWNRQNVFLSSSVLQRREEAFDRQALSQMLTNWSLAKQKKFTDKLKRVNLPIFWIAGERDIKFAAIAKELSLCHPKSKVRLCQGAGHRVLWDVPHLFKRMTNDFIRSL